MSGVEPNVIQAGDILLVDDTVANLELLTYVLGEAGYRTRPASNGRLALRSAQARQPALILLDILMPDMDGFEVCRRLKENESTRDIPVIFLSGLAETADKSKGFELGAVDYITKPFEAAEALARVRVHLALAAAKEQLRTQNLQLQIANERLNGEIAERKRASEALRESRDQLDALNLSVGNGIISVNEKQRIVLFSTASERMFGRTTASMIGQPLNMLLPERFRIAHETHIRRFDASGQSNRTMGTYGSIFGLRANGEEFPVEATVSQSGVSPNKLFTVVLRDITERRQKEQMREQLVRQLELLSERLAMGQEKERLNLAHELHEELGQELATLKVYLQMLEPGSAGTQTESPHKHALGLAAHATSRIRELVTNLEPPELSDFGLYSAVRTYSQRQALAGGWNLRIDTPKPDLRAPRPIERACFRVLQESLSNVLQHAKATEVWVNLQQDAEEMILGIRDNGIGFDCNAFREENRREYESLGLFGMQLWAQHVGGSVEIVSVPGGGTEVRAVFPLSE
jgi:PAS domain S-box-containing protein